MLLQNLRREPVGTPAASHNPLPLVHVPVPAPLCPQTLFEAAREQLKGALCADMPVTCMEGAVLHIAGRNGLSTSAEHHDLTCQFCALADGPEPAQT